MNKKVIFLFVLHIVLLPLFASRSCPTHYQYQDLAALAPYASTHTIDNHSLEKWDKLVQIYLDENKVRHQSRFFAYLYTAMRDAIFLSWEVKDHFEGSIDPLMYKICTLFYDDFQKPESFVTDEYSEALATMVGSLYQKRYEYEEKQMDEEKGPRKATKMTFWLLKETLLPPSPKELEREEGLQKQIAILKKACKTFTEEDERKALLWAGLLYPNSGDWRLIALNYMEKHNTIFAKEVLVRSHLMMALVDGIIDSMRAKYYYNFPRPPLKDSTLIPSVPLPSTPSYPSGHAVEAAVANVLLSYYFPSGSKEFTQLAKEAAFSRICAKVHYPLDRKAGLNLGQKIGTIFLERTEHEPL